MPFYFIVCLEVFRLDVQMLWKPFPTQGSHNTQAEHVLNLKLTPTLSLL